jgi:hypothetical protein
MADTWAVFLANYTTSGIPDAEVLRDIGGVMDIDAILQGELVNIVQRDGVFGITKGQPRVTVRFTLLDTRTGRLIWEDSSDGFKSRSTTVGEAHPIIEAVHLAVDRLVSAVPIG